MNKLFFDIETTGLNPYTSEMITAYFELYDNSMNLLCSHSLKSQVNNWNEDAVEIHKITKAEMLSYPSKRSALDDLCLFLSSVGRFEAILYANPNTQLGFLHFDCATIQMELMDHLEVNRVEKQPFAPFKITSVYTLAKQAARDGMFTAIKGKSGRQSFSQVNVYKAIFNESYNSHVAEDDVAAMIRIYNFLTKNKSNTKVYNDQLSIL